MANANIQIEITALDKASKKLDNISKSLNPMRGKVGRVGTAFEDVDRSIGKVQKSSSGLKKAFGALAGVAATVGLGRMASDAIEAFTGYERLQVQLETYLGSQEKANSEMARLQDLANSLPQDLADITGAFVTLTRVGVDTSNESITALSNVATANAKDFDQLAEALADSLTGEFERLKEFGVKVSKENGQFVADFGKGNKQVFDSAKEVTDAVIAMGEEGGRFGDAAKINAGTLSQSFSNLKGAVFEAQVAFGEGAKGGMKEFTEALTALVRDNKGLITSLGEGLGSVLAALPDAFVAVKQVMDDLEPVFRLIGTIATEVVIPLGKLAFETLVGLADAIQPVAETWIPILKDAFVSIASAISGTVTAAFEGIKVVIDTVIGVITSAVDTAVGAYNTIKGIADKAGAAAGFVGDKAGQLGSAVAEKGGELVDGIKDTGADVYRFFTSPFRDADEEIVSNSIVPDMVNAIGGWMDRLPSIMADPAQIAANKTTDAFNQLMGAVGAMQDMNPQVASPVSGIAATSGNIASNVSFNISGVNIGANEKPTQEMQKYIEGVAVQVANKVLRQNTAFGGLV